MAADPAVSVVLIVGSQRARATRALESVLSQEGFDRAEVVLVECASTGTEPLPGADHAGVRTLPRPGRGAFGDLRAEAVREARAPIVAFVEEHVVARPGWLEGIERAMAPDDVAGVGGEVDALNPGVGISDVVATMNYARWQPPARARSDADLIVGHNAAYRREHLLGLEPRLGRLLGSEVVLQRALRAGGGRLVVEPSVRIAHLNETTTRAICRGYYLWNVSFGDTWSGTEQWSWARRAAQVIGTPWWVTRRVTQTWREAGPDARRVLRRRPATVLAAQVAGAAGIAVGCTLGDRGHGRRFTDYELDAFRASASST